jgi:hypothetical protein
MKWTQASLRRLYERLIALLVHPPGYHGKQLVSVANVTNCQVTDHDRGETLSGLAMPTNSGGKDHASEGNGDDPDDGDDDGDDEAAPTPAPSTRCVECVR